MRLEFRVECWGFGSGSVTEVEVRVGRVRVSLAKERYPFSFGGRSEWIGLKTLAYQLVKLPRSKQRKNNNVVYSTLDFESLKLEKEIVKSACIDVYVSYRIGHKLIKEI
uniref:Uncharacterized protein n=1 Tax=Cannabis sativa TaxID=3483 RepID=A0A803NPT6_CANSA